MSDTSNPQESQKQTVGGLYAILGMDFVSFSTLHDDDQISAIESLIRWTGEALAFHGLKQHEYRWSPAGDGGYLTFITTNGSRKAVDVAFSMFEKIQRPDWRPRSGEKMLLKMALHTGTVQEAREFGRGTNIWGLGINTTERILSVSLPSQVLVSKQYFDAYIKGQREDEFEIGDVHWRTVKHGIQVEVMNINRNGMCIDEDQASAKRWRFIGGLWCKTIREYNFLIHDTMRSGDPVAALAAAKFLLNLGERKPVWDLCQMIGQAEVKPACEYPPQRHPLFGQMPPDILMKIVEQIRPRILNHNEVICNQGDPAESSFFPVSGQVVVDVPGIRDPIAISKGQIIGEFSLWIPNLPRTARVRTIDEGLMLEIHNKSFKEILDKSPDVADLVYGIIKRRIVENTLKSQRLFPEIGMSLKEELSSIPATCEKQCAGTTLELDKAAYILFSGKVRVSPRERAHLDLVGLGIFGSEPVVGLVSRIGYPDGPRATVIEDSVLVKIDHEIIRDLQGRFALVRNAWNGLCGQRLGEIHDLEKGSE